MPDEPMPPPRTITLSDGSTVFVGGTTQADQDQRIADLADAAAELRAARQILGNLTTGWAELKDLGSDLVTMNPPFQVPTTPVPTGAVSLALHGQQITYLYNALMWLIADVVAPMGDAVLLVAKQTVENMPGAND